MEKELLMAVDLGTSFVKVGVYDTDSHCSTEATEPVKDYRPGPGVFIQKGDELFASVIACMKSVCEKLGSRARHIEAISFTGQMSGFMGVNKDWEDMTTWSCSLDSRYMPYANRQMERFRDHFLTVGGTNFPQMAPKYEWFRTEYPQKSSQIAKYLMISGYVIGRLGEMAIEDAVIDRSYISWTGLADVSKDQWSGDLCKEIKLDEARLPRIVNSNFICGRLSSRAAGETGMKAGIPLVSGAGDKVAGCLGSATVSPGGMVLEASSYGEISCCVEEYRPDMAKRRLDVLCSAVPGEFYVTHFAAGSGITLDWFVNTFARRPGESLKDAFSRLDSEAAAIPAGCNGIMAIGLLSGSSMPLDGALRGMWMGFDWSHGTAEFYRSLLESFAYDWALSIASIERLYPGYPLSAVRMVGGGANSPLWAQMHADVNGRAVCTLNRKDISMWGASILAGNAIGLFPDLKETARKYVGEDKTFMPESKNKPLYKAGMKLYEDYLVELSGFYKRIQALAQG